ncbi:MAG: serine hydrolase [Pseudomonadota bacterium]
MSRLFWISVILVISPAQANEQDILEGLQRIGVEDQASTVLFWSDAQRRVGFKNMAKISPTRTISASDNVYPLTDAPMDLSGVTYEVDGEQHSLKSLLDDSALIGLAVVQDDEVLMEHYAEGNNRASLWISFSVSKSVTSMLIGAAVQDGYIESVDEPVTNYLPRLRGTSYEKATIRNVLNMASGVRWNEDYADPESDVAKAGGLNGLALVNYLADLPIEAKAGDKFNYNTGETNLVGEILRSAIGNNASTYLTKKIWQPFGMESDAVWNLDSEHGAELGGCCINASLRDYARLGIFAMQGGTLGDGTQVLPENWMQDSITSSKGANFYGYLWWLFGDRGYAAQGIFGQTIRIYPEDNLVIAVHSNAKAAVGTPYHDHYRAALEAIRDYVVANR